MAAELLQTVSSGCLERSPFALSENQGLKKSCLNRDRRGRCGPSRTHIRSLSSNALCRWQSTLEISLWLGESHCLAAKARNGVGSAGLQSSLCLRAPFSGNTACNEFTCTCVLSSRLIHKSVSLSLPHAAFALASHRKSIYADHAQCFLTCKAASFQYSTTRSSYSSSEFSTFLSANPLSVRKVLDTSTPNSSTSFVRRSVRCRAIFTKLSDILGFRNTNERKLEEESEGAETENGKLLTLPPNPWELSKDMVEEDETPYIPEVDERAALREEVLKELSSQGATAIKVENVSKTFVTRSVGARQVVHNVSVNVEPGSMVALVGTSGSGKTTLMRMIAGLESTTTGKIYFDDKDMTGVKVQDRDVGVMFQSYALFKHMTVKENIGYGLNTRKRTGELTKEKLAKRVNDLLELVQLSDLGDRYPPQLSGGQRQRVALARALATQPRVLLLDEPFGALDAIVRQELRSWVRKLQKALQITTIFVTHDQDEALEMADLMIVFHRGRIMQMGPPFEVFQRPTSPFVMNFMCDPNIFRATSLAVRRSGLRTSRPSVLVRPNDAVLFFEERRDKNTTPATVTLVNNMGSEVELELSYDDGEKLEFVRQRYDWEDQPLEVGQRVHVQLKPLLMMPFAPEDLRA